MPSVRLVATFFAVGFVSLYAACGPSAPANCLVGETSCSDECVDVNSDPANCGGCGVTCNAGESCAAGQCVPGTEPCDPGTTESCYNGPVGTEGVGPCTGGTRTCNATGTGFGPCQGEVTPTTEICGNGIDENCNSIVDDEADADGDGWTNCNGDCCDTPSSTCADPGLVNPGAFEVAGNQVDDDCDGTVDNAVTADCDSGLASGSTDPMDYARAMDLCQTTTETGSEWGVISAELVLSSGTGTPSTASRSIRPGFGGTSTQHGASLAMLSTGHAAAPGDTSPSYVSFQGGQDTGTSSSVPMDWLTANGNNFPNAPGCPEPQGGTTAHNPIMLKLRVRVPTNANSFSISTNFFSSEYPEWVCSAFNDFFVALLDSGFAGSPANPSDKNLARYTAPGGAIYPVGVNLAFNDTGLFRVCKNGDTGCGGGSIPDTTSSCTGTTELTGTGFDIANPGPHPDFTSEPGYCGTNNLLGGGTGWLVTSGNVVPGEIIELRFAIWDTGDPWYDSVVLLDNFQWSVAASDPGTVID